MYLSCLLIDTGDNPDRPRPGRLWLRNLYHVHQRLCMAFPSASRKSDDADFLKPFDPADFGSDQVHVVRALASGFLFRIDPGPAGRAVILVQSGVSPDWCYAFHNAGYLLAAPAEVKPYDPPFRAGQRLRFRLLANPTRKIDTIRKEERQRSTKEELSQKNGRHGRRVPVPSAEELSAWSKENPGGDVRDFISTKLLAWLEGKAEPSGFALQSVSVQPGYSYFQKGKKPRQSAPAAEENSDGKGARLRSVRYDGALTVTDVALFRASLARGIGPGKAFGFGLLSVAPC